MRIITFLLSLMTYIINQSKIAEQKKYPWTVNTQSQFRFGPFSFSSLLCQAFFLLLNETYFTFLLEKKKNVSSEWMMYVWTPTLSIKTAVFFLHSLHFFDPFYLLFIYVYWHSIIVRFVFVFNLMCVKIKTKLGSSTSPKTTNTK